MARNHYVVLGIERCADTGQIKHAYRRIAKQLHPDRTCPSADPERFMEAKEAYETLADAERRRRYDDELTRRESAPGITRVPETRRDRSHFYREGAPLGSLVDELFERWVHGATRLPGLREIEKDIYLEVILSARESREGGLFPIQIPAMVPCPQCRPGSILDELVCPACGGYGGVRIERSFSLGIPPRTADGTSVALSLEDIGLRGVRLHLEIRVDPRLEG
jgi:molecular chaperone DnaJ